GAVSCGCCRRDHRSYSCQLPSSVNKWNTWSLASFPKKIFASEGLRVGRGLRRGPLFMNRFLEVLERQPQACFKIDLRLPSQKSSSLGDVRPPLLRIVLRQRFVPDFAFRSGNRQHTVRTS